TTFIKTDKFKTINIDIAFLGDFTKENATKRSLLTRLLTIATKSYPTKKAMANKLYDLYDASLLVSTYPSYKTSVTVFNFSLINPKYTGDANLIPEALAFLKDVIFNPNVTDQAFSEKNFLEQKRVLKENIKNIYNNKSRYALRQLLQNMSRNEIFSVSSIGSVEDLEPLTAHDIYMMYRNMIDNENVSIFVTGDFDNQEMIEHLKILDDFKGNPKPTSTVSEDEVNVEKVKEIVEKQNINQAKLLMGFRTDVNTLSEKFAASLLFNAIFGGTFSSDLIRVVREENSLAYYIVSQIINDVKLLIVTAGIDQNQYQFVSDLVIKQLELYKQGHINGDLLSIGKENIINELVEIEDSPYKISTFILRNYLHNIEMSVTATIDKIKNVTTNEIIEVANGINLDTIFLLAGEDYNG
ncbi:MAG: insulinase family protein, partial [Bacilli bacterium]|nr:insulinase family protein [Bacilli bacterium]